MICWSCDYYDSSTDACNADDKCYTEGYQQGRADVLREHREQCQGKCFKCEVSVPFINSDGEEVILPYSYSYKTDCEDNRYINAKEVLSLIIQARADAIDEIIKAIDEQNYCMQEECPFNACRFEGCPINRNAEVIFQIWLKKIAEQLKEQKNES